MDTRSTFYRRRGKRILDLAVSAAAIAIFAPLLCFLALLVRMFLGSPVLFRQARGGFQQRLFTMIKFRSMTDGRDAAGNLLPDTKRLTRLGSFLRATSLDELPELINVLRGEMSLVGPRPLLPQYGPWYTATEAKRFDVLPGITGWAQINGRNALSWDERFEYDVQYVENCGLLFDLKILVLTLGKVLGVNTCRWTPA